MTASRLFRVCATTLLVAGCTDGPDGPSTRPSAKAFGPQLNVVLISIDTLRHDHLGVYGYEPETSPNLTNLARQGVVFDSAFAVHTNTAPAHASMMTGLYPGSHGLRRNGMSLLPQATPLAEILKKHGFETAAFVSGETLCLTTKIGRGFDVYDCELRGNGQRSAPDTWEATKRWLTQARPKNRPFFLFFHLFDPHYPYDPPARILAQFLAPDRKPLDRLHENLPGRLAEAELTEEDKQEYVARYDGEIALSDHATGQLLATLDAEGLRESTLVIVTSDHGETLFGRPWVLDHGGRVYDEQIRIPMIMRFPDGSHAGRRIAAPVSQVDLLPTVAELLEIPLPSAVSGRSMIPLLSSDVGSDPRPAFAHGRPVPKRVPEVDAPLMLRGLITTIRLPNVKLIEYPQRGGGYYQQLFLLDADPDELTNASASQGALAESLHIQLEDFRRKTRTHTRPPLPKLEPEVEERLRILGYLE